MHHFDQPSSGRDREPAALALHHARDGRSLRRRRCLTTALMATWAFAACVCANAETYDIVPRFSSLTLSGTGRTVGSGTIKFDITNFATGTGTFDFSSGSLQYELPIPSAATAAVGGTLRAVRQGEAWHILEASIRPVLANVSPDSRAQWSGGMAGDVSFSNEQLTGTALSGLLASLQPAVSVGPAFTVGAVDIGLSGSSTIHPDGTFSTSSFDASIAASIGVSPWIGKADWSSTALPLQGSEAWVGGRDDGTLVLPVTFHWHQTLSLPLQAFEGTKKLSPITTATFSGTATGTAELDWSLSGTLMAVAAEPVPEPSTPWLLLAGLMVLSRGAARSWTAKKNTR